MALKIFNTLTRKTEEFKPIKDKVVGMYTCGPTVYNYVHIGNLRAIIVYDLMRRYLKYKGYDLKHVMNITDVDDKTIKGSKAEGKSLLEFTQFYTDAFLQDLKTLNIEIPEIMPRATEEIDAMVSLVKVLLDKGFAYKSEKGDIYFSIAKFENYGKMALIDPEKLKTNAEGRLDDEYDKEDARDFALWKAWDEDDGPVFWETEIGKGRPGWHIECSAMSSKYLGQPFDVHMGGVDLVFPHHTNEIAQSEAAHDKKFCNFWLHNEHLIVNGEKMSKSLGNFFTLKDLLSKGYDPYAIRLELLSTHYRQKLDFREDNLKNSKNTLDKIADFISKLEANKDEKYNPDVPKVVDKYKTKFMDSLDNDLNVSGALAAMFELMTEINKLDYGKINSDEVMKFMEELNSVLGIINFEEEEIPDEIMQLVQEREKARDEKDYGTSDRLRDEIKQKGYEVKDTDKGPVIRKI